MTKKINMYISKHSSYKWKKLKENIKKKRRQNNEEKEERKGEAEIKITSILRKNWLKWCDSNLLNDLTSLF